MPPARALAAATAAYAILTSAVTWPLVLHPGSRVANDLGDPLLNMWLLAWNARVLPLTQTWWNAPQFFPAAGSMAYSEHLLGLAPVTSPILWTTGNAVLAYNAAFFLSFFLSALAGHALGWSLTRRHDAAFVAGLAFGFAPYRAAQLGHLQVISTYWMPLALAGLTAFRHEPRWRWLALFAIAWIMQALACGYYFFFFSVLVGLWVVWLIASPSRALAPRVLVAWVAAAAALAPILYGYWRIQRHFGFRRLPDEIVAFSADVGSVLRAPSNVRLWGWLDVVERPEAQIFPGATIVVLVAAGVLAARRGARGALAFYAAAAVVMWALALGPQPTLMNEPFLPWGPYAWFMVLPGADGVRVPARFWMLAVLCLAAAGALAYAALATRWPRARVALATLVCIGIVADGWQEPMEFPEPPAARPSRTAAIARIDLPFVESHDVRALYRAIAHRRPLMNGYSGHFPPHHGVLKRLLNDDDHDALRHMAQFGDLEVVVDHAYDRDGRWRNYVETYPGIEPVHQDDRHSSFRIRESAEGRAHRPLEGVPLPIASVAVSDNDGFASRTIDGDFTTRWELGRGQAPGDWLSVDVGAVKTLRGIELAVGRYTADYPRRVRVETSADGAMWEAAWSGAGGGPTLTAAIVNPTEVPITFPIPSRRARFVRVTQLGADPVFYWSVAEIRVYGH